MKKLVRKLALSCAALAVCAATLVSSTFAWYTSNTDVSASGMTATTASTGDKSILISATGETGTWSSTAEETETEVNVLPVQATVVDGAIVFKDKAGTANAAATDIYDFTLFFKTTPTDSAVNLYIKSITLTNNATELTKWDNLNLNVDDAGITKTADQYAVDITQALWMSFEGTSYEDNKGNIYDLAATDTTPLETVGGASDALAYYNKIMGDANELTKPLTGLATEKVLSTSGTAPVQVAVLPANGDAVSVKFNIFLNGWDDLCFDACKGQTFNLTIQFTTETSTVEYKA